MAQALTYKGALVKKILAPSFAPAQLRPLAAIWKMNQWMEDLSLLLSLCKSALEIKINKS